jgi:hypothetical protein
MRECAAYQDAPLVSIKSRRPASFFHLHQLQDTPKFATSRHLANSSVFSNHFQFKSTIPPDISQTLLSTVRTFNSRQRDILRTLLSGTSKQDSSIKFQEHNATFLDCRLSPPHTRGIHQRHPNLNSRCNSSGSHLFID